LDWPASPSREGQPAEPGQTREKSGPRNRLEVILPEWAKVVAATRSVRRGFTVTTVDPVFKERNVSQGVVQFLAPDLLRIDTRHEAMSVLLFRDKTIHWFNPAQKTELVFDRPADGCFLGARTGKRSWKFSLFGAIGEGFLQQTYWLFAGLPVRDLARRCTVRLAKEDSFCISLDIEPRRREDAKGFEKMRVVLLAKEFRVRQVWLRYTSGAETTLDFDPPDGKAKVTEGNFRPKLPAGWKRVAITVDGFQEME
jgi:hypothetical protein